MYRRPILLATLFLPALLIASVGCTETRVYRVTVRNKTDGPITVGVTKAGPPLEPAWLSPEEMTDIPPSHRPDHWGRVVDPGMKASVRVEGRFDSGSRAFLRVYRGNAPLDDLLAMSHGTGSRTDVILTPNEINDYTIEDPRGQLTPHLTRLTAPPH